MATKRKPISKKLRFEVFKRDSFTCQYCGRKAPDTTLNCDHIDPVSNGGTNDILNLVTSCFSCNSGKSDRLLSDDSALVKQRSQLEALQSRREQIEMMIDWKASLSRMNDEIELIAIDYLSSKIYPFTLSETGQRRIANHVKKFGIDDVMEAIDIGAKKYLKYNSIGDLVQDSVETLMGKIGGVMMLKRMGPIKQKLAYTRGIARNRFNYWDNRVGAIVLSKLIEAMKDRGESEEWILEYIETIVIPFTKKAKHWKHWKEVIQNTIEEVNTQI